MSNYLKSLTSFSGADLVVSFGTATIGELQSISWGVQREKAPVYTLGNPDPRSFSRGKRGIAGNLVFAVFDRDSLLEEMRKQFGPSGSSKFPVMFTAAGNAAAGARGAFDEALEMTEWNGRSQSASFLQIAKGDTSTLTKLGDRATAINANAKKTYGNVGAVRDNSGLAVPAGFDLITPETLTYADTLPPLDITATFANEFGQAAFMRILDVDILNDGSGVSVDTVVMERAMTWIARKISPITAGIYDRDGKQFYKNDGTSLTKDGLGV